MILSWVDRNNYVTRGSHTITGKIFAKNSRQGIIPVLGPVLRTCIKDLYYDSTDFLNTGPNEPFPFHKKIRPVTLVKSEFPGYNGKRGFSQL